MASISETSETVEQLILAILKGSGTDLDDPGAQDLTLSQLRTLGVIGNVDQPLAIHQIGERLGLTIATAGRNVDRLVKLKLVTRTECPEDRRVKLVALTAKGRDVFDRRMESKRVVIEQIIAKASTQQRTALRDAIIAVLPDK